MNYKQRHIFKGKLLNLYTKRHRFPTGFVTNLEIIKHPGAVLIVPFLSKKEIILIRQYRPVINKTIWELPAGTLHKGEDPLSCAKREIIEEIGYRAESWKRIGIIYPAPGYTTEKIIIYEAHRLKKVDSRIQEDEIISAKVLSKRKIQNLINTGKIVDAKTICVLTLAKLC